MKPYVTKVGLRSGRRNVKDASIPDLFEQPEQPEDILFDVSDEPISPDRDNTLPSAASPE